MMNLSMEGIGSLFTSAREAITGEKIIDPVEAGKLELQFKQLEQALSNGQIAINKEEAKHPSIFVAGWRPFIGWVCGMSLMFHFIVFPTTMWILAIFSIAVPNPPIFDMQSLMTILGGLLGLGGLRTFEKVKNVERNR